ncbi:15797_t:CDS:2, partial [Acaulospora colombiana]
DDPNTFVSIAETIPSIRRVTFLNVIGRFSRTGTGFELAAESSHQLSWTHFKWSRYTVSFPMPLLHRLLNITSLYLGGNLSVIKTLVSIIHQFPNLLSFETFVSLNHGDDLLSPPMLLSNRGVRTLKMLISPPDNYDLLDNPKERELLLIECHRIPEMLLHAMPNADYLKLSIIGGQSSFPFFSLRESFIGNEMFIYFSECMALVSEDMQIPSSVETLFIDCNWSALCSLSSGTLKHLDLLQDFGEDPADEYLEDVCSPIAPLERQIDLRSWPSLETICLYKNWVRWDQASLNSLRTVTIWESDYYKVVDNVTYFLKEIACRPESYPSMEEIHLGACPEWDILLIMLERRNLFSSSQVRRIKKLGISSRIPRNIHLILAELLRLRVDIESLDNSNKTRVERAAICAIEHCAHHDEVLIGELHEYPDNDDDALGSWCIRAKLWDQWNGGRSWRELCCQDQKASSIILIDADSYP